MIADHAAVMHRPAKLRAVDAMISVQAVASDTGRDLNAGYRYPLLSRGRRIYLYLHFFAPSQ
jgi:hypothetical protein